MTQKQKPKTPSHVRHTAELIRSPAMRVLSRTGHKALMCIESELCRHGGKDNGKLPVTYEDFERFGLYQHGISAALREIEALGLSQITEHGRGGNAEYRRPNLLRLTYLPVDDDHPATNEWKAITTVEEAEAIAQKARAAMQQSRISEKHFSPPKKAKARPLKTGVENGRFRPLKTGVKGRNFRPLKTGVLSRRSSHLVSPAAAVPPPGAWPSNSQNPDERLQLEQPEQSSHKASPEEPAKMWSTPVLEELPWSPYWTRLALAFEFDWEEKDGWSESGPDHRL